MINILFGWLTEQDPIDIRFKLVLIKRYKQFLISFSFLILLIQFKHVTDGTSKSIFHSKLENEISLLSTLSTTLEILIFYSHC